MHNGAATLGGCLEALLSAPGPTRGLIVVDNGSRDDSADIAASLGVCTLRQLCNLGCSTARNSGSKHATAPILVFVDVDVVIHRDALQRISKFMSDNPDHAAVFGSYDCEPGDLRFVSQYRNLFITSSIRARTARPKHSGPGLVQSGGRFLRAWAGFGRVRIRLRTSRLASTCSMPASAYDWTRACWANI